MSNPVLNTFNDRLPRKPYCSDDLQYGLRILPKAQALVKRYIQPNPPHSSFSMVFDVDRAGSAIDWTDRSCPTPNLTIMNLSNAHSHLVYHLETGVCTAPDARAAPLRYAAAIERALCMKLDADAGYAGLVCKNPNHAEWRVTQWQPKLYTLDWLADYLDLRTANGLVIDAGYGLGRNCTIFEKTRQWAYRAIRRGWPDLPQWSAACFERATAYNLQFSNPLIDNEVKAIAKSIARWTHKRFTEKAFAQYVAQTHTSEIQSVRGAKGGIVGGKISKGGGRPTVGTYEIINEIHELKVQGHSHRMIARKLNISPSTVSLLSQK